MPTYTLETGNMDAHGHWSVGSYSATFEAMNLEEAKAEVNRRSREREIPSWEKGRAFRVFSDNESSWRPFKEEHEDVAWS